MGNLIDLANQSTFNFELAEGFKADGMLAAAYRREDVLVVARTIAIEVCRRKGEVTADDVYREMIRRGIEPSELGNAAGSLFRVGFVFTGRWKKSVRVSNHARMNRVWVMRNG